MHQAGQSNLATDLIGKAISITPRHAPYHNSLGNALHTLGDVSGAIASYLAAVEHDPSDPDALINLANISTAQHLFRLAIPLYERALELAPSDRGLVTLLGRAYMDNGDMQKALLTFHRAIQMDPHHAASHLFLGHAMSSSGDFAGSLPSFHEAIRLDPTCHEAHNGLGAAYEGLEAFPQAATAFATAHSILPTSVEYLINIGLNMARRGDPAGSAYLDQAIHLAPDHVEAHVVLAEILLSAGDYPRGWQEYEWRWRKPEFLTRTRPFVQPMWRGDPLNGRVILLHAEQGYGDTIQFTRFIDDVVRLGGVVLLEVQSALYRLLQHLPGVHQCFRQGVDPLPAFDVHCPLMSLPGLLGTTIESLPLPTPLAFHDTHSSPLPTPVERPLRIGLVWSGNPQHTRDAFRSIPLRQFLPLSEVPGVLFVSLQKNSGTNDQDALSPSPIPMSYPLRECEDFLDTSNVIADLDLILSVDTAVAHLAASIGKPVWLLLPQAADWRWGFSGEKSPWYPSIRLLRQTPECRPSELIARVAKELSILSPIAYPPDIAPPLSSFNPPPTET